MEIDKLFFELLQVAIGNAECMSHMPTNKEWKALYDIAKKQSLVGVSFAALHRLGADVDEGYTRIGIPEDVYFYWIGMAAKIQQKNDLVNQKCVKLQKRLSKKGLQSCVLKGQSVVALYGNELSRLRQLGDIDAWVNASRNDIIKYVQKIAPTTNVLEHLA